MRFLQHRFVQFVVSGLVLFGGDWLAVPLSAAEKSGPDKPAQHKTAAPKVDKRGAEEAVAEALQREIFGLADERATLLNNAVAKAPNFAPARWQLGLVRDPQRGWLKFDDFASGSSFATEIQKYEKVRSKAPDTVAGQLELAQWCKQQEMYAQGWAHLSRVLELEPNHLAARAELGFHRVGGRWLSREELAADALDQRKQQVSLQEYGKTCQELVQVITSGRKLNREASLRKRLETLNDPLAVPALEAIVSPVSDKQAYYVLNLLATIPDSAATLSLARHAVYYPSNSIRATAAEDLRSRDPHGFVP